MSELLSVSPATTWILIIVGICSFVGWSVPGFMEDHIFSPRPILRDREYSRLFSSAFLHGDLMHLLFNCFVLYSFGAGRGGLENKIGTPAFLLIFLASVLGGNLLSLFLHKHEEYYALGASGGVSGIIFAHAFLLNAKIIIFPIPFGMPSLVFAILFILISSYGIHASRDNVGHDAHLGGAITGLLLTALLEPQAVIIQSTLKFFSVLALTVLAFFYFVKNPWSSPQKLQHQIKSFFNTQRAKFEKSKDRQTKNDKTDDSHSERLDEILDKISEHGMKSLTEEEKRIIERFSGRR